MPKDATGLVRRRRRRRRRRSHSRLTTWCLTGAKELRTRSAGSLGVVVFWAVFF